MESGPRSATLFARDDRRNAESAPSGPAGNSDRRCVRVCDRGWPAARHAQSAARLLRRSGRRGSAATAVPPRASGVRDPVLEDGEELANISKLLGHADVSTTANLYAPNAGDRQASRG